MPGFEKFRDSTPEEDGLSGEEAMDKHRKFKFSTDESKKDNLSGQLDAFHEMNPELRDKYNRANFRVSILGGDEGEGEARELGTNLTENWFKIQTGGYNTGTMKAALEGADKAIEKMKEDPKKKEVLKTYADPSPVGIVAERFDPVAGATTGENVSVVIEEGENDIYKRMARLIEESSANVLLPGGTGTQLELGAAMHFDRKLKDRFNIPQSPLIIVGDYWHDYLRNNFKKEIEESDNTFRVESVEEAEELIQLLYQKENADEEEAKELSEKIEERRYTFDKSH